MTSEAPRPRRRRDPEASRAAILAAAREAFTELGYDRASVREIARRAGAASGLVLRHFESKDRLFLAAFVLPTDPEGRAGITTDAAEPGDLAALVAQVLGGPERDPSAAPFLALIRSAASRPEAAVALRSEMQRRFRALLDTGAQDEQADLRVDVFGALMIGLTYVRHVLGAGPLAEASPEEVARIVVPVSRAVLESDAGGSPVAR